MLAYLGLGSNLNSPRSQIKSALKALANLPQIDLLACSGLYQSRPHGVTEQPDFINAVAKINTTFNASELLQQLQYIENLQQRQRDRRFGPRTLDLDILLYANLVLTAPELTLPHYAMFEREFVLYPLFEIAPDLQFNDGIYLRQKLANCPANGLKLVESIDLGALA